jgi:uncharacterized membrane-anchored protein YhcB (DUF1043 family)
MYILALIVTYIIINFFLNRYKKKELRKDTRYLIDSMNERNEEIKNRLGKHFDS